MMNDLPALPDLAAAALAVGLLFGARFALSLRRLRVGAGSDGDSIRNLWGARTAGRFGADREPERRHSLRQGAAGCLFLGVAAILYVWIGLAHLGWLPTSTTSPA